jgi:hypothetical protein
MGAADSRREPAVPADHTLIADVRSSGAVYGAPRTVQLRLASNAVAVRDLQGGLLWLETDKLSAFTDPDGATRVTTHTTTPPVMTPRDTASEARALASLRGVGDWLDARPDLNAAPKSTVRLGRPAELYRLVTSDGREITATRDLATGVILRVEGASPRGDFTVELTSFELARSLSTDFKPNRDEP